MPQDSAYWQWTEWYIYIYFQSVSESQWYFILQSFDKYIFPLFLFTYFPFFIAFFNLFFFLNLFSLVYINFPFCPFILLIFPCFYLFLPFFFLLIPLFVYLSLLFVYLSPPFFFTYFPLFFFFISSNPFLFSQPTILQPQRAYFWVIWTKTIDFGTTVFVYTFIFKYPNAITDSRSWKGRQFFFFF